MEHFKTDWHRYNIKQRLKGARSVTEVAFAQVAGLWMAEICLLFSLHCLLWCSCSRLGSTFDLSRVPPPNKRRAARSNGAIYELGRPLYCYLTHWLSSDSLTVHFYSQLYHRSTPIPALQSGAGLLSLMFLLWKSEVQAINWQTHGLLLSIFTCLSCEVITGWLIGGV